MRRVTLRGTDVTTSVLGYGCGGLMARMDRRASVRCLELAFDAGVTHFDVARMYGYGEAESALGDFLAGRRDQVTVTTKLGIAPPRASAALSAAKAIARRGVALVPALRGAARRRAAQLHSAGRFGVADARASLETSLRELRTDHVDLLLLHECSPEDVAQDELLGFLTACVENGTVRQFGIATDPAAARRIIDETPAYAPVVQLPNSVLAPAADAIGDLSRRPVISHSVLFEALEPVQAHVTASDGRRRDWSEAVGADCADRTVLAGLMLAAASWAGDAAIALFSSRSPDRIHANVERAGSVTPEQVSRFVDLVARELRPAAAPA